MVLHRRLKITILHLIFLILIISSCYTNNLAKLEKIRIYFQYDYLFHYDGYKKNLTVEKSSSRELFKISDISKKYQPKAAEYINLLTAFSSNNLELLIEYYKAATDFSIPEEIFEKTYDDLNDLVKTELLTLLPGVIRCMVASYDMQYLQVAIQIDKNLFATTVDADSFSTVFWKDYYRDDPPPYINPEGVIDDQGVIKYHEWFYESNLKLRVVKQIRDKDGKYYGEIYADYYKLDEYDNLFDKDGNPKHPKEDAK